MTKVNIDIRQTAKSKKIPFWKIAKHLGISEPTFTRWMREELSEEKRERITLAIEELANNEQA
ncbi:MAG: hypothetical protein PUB37_01200 [Firmicutes bacterium]|nr:hypothetical protein [Bacillota bacterium]